MNRKYIILWTLIIALVTGCSRAQPSSGTSIDEKSNNSEVEMKISTVNADGKGIDGAKVILIGYDGSVIDILNTDANGSAAKKIMVKHDPRYSETSTDGLNLRGTITAIAFKDGYKESILFEAAASEPEQVQQIIMNPIIEGERNEPDVSLGNSHHLEILSLVNKYGTTIGQEAHY